MKNRIDNGSDIDWTPVKQEPSKETIDLDAKKDKKDLFVGGGKIPPNRNEYVQKFADASAERLHEDNKVTEDDIFDIFYALNQNLDGFDEIYDERMKTHENEFFAAYQGQMHKMFNEIKDLRHMISDK